MAASTQNAPLLSTNPGGDGGGGGGGSSRNVYVRILEEPASKALRFRYECEGRSAGSLPGANSTQDKKSFPKIQVLGHRGRAVVVVSCVTIDPPYRPHPHNLVGKEGCKKGVCTMEIANDDMTCEFSNLGIQCVKKKDIEDSLKVREEIRVDPFRTGFQHKSQPGSIDLNSVRLCFQVFLEGPEHGQFKVPLKPVVSEPIYDKKAINDLTIMKLSDCTSPVMGNKEVILLCDKVSKDDIEVRFYEESEETGAIVWESFGDFQPSDVHKQYAICFRTPQYHNLEITSPARVFIQLRCPSKDSCSTPRPFQYIPLLTSGTGKRKWNLVTFSDTDLKRKRQKLENSRTLYQYFEHNKRPRQNSYPPVNSPPVVPGAAATPTLQHQHHNPDALTSPPPPPQTPQQQQQQTQSLMQQQHNIVAQQQPSPQPMYTSPPPPSHTPLLATTTQTQPIQLLHGSVASQQQQQPPPPQPPPPQVYIKQEPSPMGTYEMPPPQYYEYMMMLGNASSSSNNNPSTANLIAQHQAAAAVAAAAAVQYSGGGIIKDQQQDPHHHHHHHHLQQQQPNPPDNNEPGGGGGGGQLNSDFSLPNLSDVNLSLLDQHLSENLNEMNLNNF